MHTQVTEAIGHRFGLFACTINLIRAVFLLQKLQDLLRQLIGLRNHRSAGLLQNLRPTEIGRFHRKVGVLNPRT